MRLASAAPRLARIAGAVALVCFLSVGGVTRAEPLQPAQSTAGASARATQLDELFARLKTVKEETEGDAIVAGIWKLWLQSGQPELDTLMTEATSLMALGPAAAMGILDEIVRVAPGWAEGWNKRATLLYLIGEHDRSLVDIERVLALEPRHFGAMAGRGLILIEKGQFREALAAFRSALAVNPFLKERFGVIPALEKQIGEKPL